MVLRRLGAEHAFTLVEVLIAMIIFAIVATALMGMLVSSTSITTLAKEKTVSEQGVTNQIEKIRATDYPHIGTVGGNPVGNFLRSQAFTGTNGEPLGVAATMRTSITYAGANVPGAAQTGADEKKIVVTITRNRDSHVLATAVTYAAPTQQASQTTATVQANVVDIGTNSGGTGTTLSNVPVTLTPPSGLNPQIPNGPESDVPDAGGTVTFSGLTPTDGTGTQLYTVSIGSSDLPALYWQRPLAGFDLSPTQVLPKSVQVYQPVTLNVALTNPNGTPWVGTATVKVTAGSGGTQWTWSNVAFTASGTPFVITTQGAGGDPLLPNIDYTINVQATGFVAVTDHAVVPAAGSYPATVASTLARTFTETMSRITAPPAELDVIVQETKTTTVPRTTLICRNANVTVSGGPLTSSYTGYTGLATPFTAVFANPPDASIVWNVAPYDPTPYSVTATAADGKTATNNNVTLTTLVYVMTINVGNTTASSC